MKGDKLIIHDHHRRSARDVYELILSDIEKSEGTKYCLTIAGESGSGKSEIAFVLSELLAENGYKTLILQQDDYFIYPPNSNEAKRRTDISWVGLNEVKLDLIENNLGDILSGESEVKKPLVIFDEDRITEEIIEVEDVDVVIVEGTYTTILNDIDTHIFIDRTYKETRASRMERGRETQDDFLEEVLKIEHDIISSHKPKADIIITEDYEVKRNE